MAVLGSDRSGFNCEIDRTIRLFGVGITVVDIIPKLVGLIGTQVVNAGNIFAKTKREAGFFSIPLSFEDIE